MSLQAARVNSLTIAAGGLHSKRLLSFKSGVFGDIEPPTEQAKHAATPELERILSIIEKEDGSQANSFGSRGVDTLLEYILRNAESGGKALSLAKRDNDSKLGKGLALDDAIGIVETFWNPTEVRCGERISKAREHIDIVHFHGLSWTNTNREFLQKQLSNPDIEVRVALLDPESPFSLLTPIS